MAMLAGVFSQLALGPINLFRVTDGFVWTKEVSKPCKRSSEVELGVRHGSGPGDGIFLAANWAARLAEGLGL